MDVTHSPIVFKVVYGDPYPTHRLSENVSSAPDTTNVEVRKIVFTSTPDFKQLYDKLLMIENEKYYNKDNSTSNLSRVDFRIRYIDEDDDIISIACNDDLHNAIQGKVKSLIITVERYLIFTDSLPISNYLILTFILGHQQYSNICKHYSSRASAKSFHICKNVNRILV